MNHPRKLFQLSTLLSNTFRIFLAIVHVGHVIDIHPHTPAHHRCHHATADASDGWQWSRLVIVVNDQLIQSGLAAVLALKTTQKISSVSLEH